jgi:hypothetical protein
MHAVRAETDQELQDHLRVRRAFVRDVVTDERTRRQLFAFWGHSYRIDVMVDLLIPILDRAADRAGLETRADFEDPAHFQTLVDAFPDVDDRLHLACGVEHIER